MSSITNLFRQTNPYEKFVQQLVQIESQQKFQLEAQQRTHRERKSALGEVSSTISKFVSKITELENPANNFFQPILTGSSNESVVRLDSATGINRPSNYNITIDRLANNDIVLSQVMNGDDYDLAAEGNGSATITIGETTETITVDIQKEDDNGSLIDKTNSEILESFAEKIGEQLGDVARASVFQVNSEEVQFSVQSLETGYDNRVQISDATGVLAQITNNMDHLVPQQDLNAKFTVDGVTFERSENIINDAIDGLSFTLLKATGLQEQMTIQRDLEEARSNVESFIDSFNEMNKTIRGQTFIDAENDRRGKLQNMRSIRNLTINLRQTALLPTDGIEEDELARLSEIGIGFRNDGTMYVEDSGLLDEMLAQRPDEVENLFTNENSAVANMKSQAEAYINTNGIIQSLENGLDQQISRLDSRIAAQERYLAQYEKQQRDTFNELQLIIERGQAQFEQVMNFNARMGL